ncbi:hypothetical protein VE03_10443 [Pseudogymnoascus sp. 23342-1-I1]|nr:hypothetical protein VE03_10443 [Pseudogymnoascus sp. 23342-1-I1]
MNTEQPKHYIVAKTSLGDEHTILLFWTLEDEHVFWRYADQKIAHEIPKYVVSVNKNKPELNLSHSVYEASNISTIRLETFPLLLLLEKDAKDEIARTEQFLERGHEYSVEYLVQMDAERFLCIAWSTTYPYRTKAFTINGACPSEARREINNVESERYRDGGTTDIFTDDDDRKLSFHIPKPTINELPSLVLDGRKENIIKLYQHGDPRLMEFELLSIEERRGIAQFADRRVDPRKPSERPEISGSPGQFISINEKTRQIEHTTMLQDVMRKLGGRSALGIATVAISVTLEVINAGSPKPPPNLQKAGLSVKLHNFCISDEVNYYGPQQQLASSMRIIDCGGG